MEDLRLPRCLSPLRPSTAAAKHPPAFDLPSPSTSTFNSATNQSDDVQPQSPAHGFRPWLAANSRPLQFPFSAITHGAGKSESPPQVSNRVPPGPKQLQKHMESNQQRTPTASFSVKEAEEGGATSAGRQTAAEQKSDLVKMKKKIKCKEVDAKGDCAVPKKRKRKRAACAREATPPSARQQHAKAGNATKGQINLSVCLVSLSSNNVLAKEREMAAGSNKSNAVAGKANEPGEKPRDAGDLDGNQTRIRTRGFLRKTLAPPSRPSVVSLPSNSEVCREPVVSQRDAPKRGRGRPRKTKVEGIPPESLDVKKEVQADGSLVKEESGKTKGRKKRIRDRSRAEAVPPTASSAEATLDGDVTSSEGKPAVSKRPRMVSLTEFQKLIKRQHSKTKKSRESRDEKTGETAKVAGGEDGKTFGESPRNRNVARERHAGSNATADGRGGKNLKKSAGGSRRDETSGSTGDETRRPGDGSLPVVSLDVEGLSVEEAELPAETEKPRRNPDEGKASLQKSEVAYF